LVAGMSDILATYVTGGLWVVAFVAYGLRVARFGSFRSARVDSVGGTAIMGENIMQATYWAVEPVVRGLVAVGFSANGVTTLALVLGLGAGVATGLGAFGVACLLATISTISDILDGQVARLTNTGSDTGELYDAVVDRYTEFAFIAGFIFFARDSAWAVALGLLALQSSFMISYASAKAEALKVSIPRGLMRRHERAAVLILGAGLTPVLGPALHAHWEALPESTVFGIGLALVGVIGGVAAILRFVWIRDALQGRRFAT
jgi:CDP-diacylglycerol--glycerol-3-phosphate 3-phosphatidyltransferase